MTLNQGHFPLILLFFSPNVVKEQFFELSGPIFAANIEEKEEKNVDNSIWAFMKSLTQVVMSHVVDRVRFFKLFCKLSSINPKCVKSKNSMNVKIKVSLMPWF